MGDIARFDGFVGDPGIAANAAKQPRSAQRPIRTRWADDLVKWCRDRGIKTKTTIAKYFEIDRSTLHRWQHGGRISDEHARLVFEKTNGDIDPRNVGKRR